MSRRKKNNILLDALVYLCFIISHNNLRLQLSNWNCFWFFLAWVIFRARIPQQGCASASSTCSQIFTHDKRVKNGHFVVGYTFRRGVYNNGGRIWYRNCFHDIYVNIFSLFWLHCVSRNRVCAAQDGKAKKKTSQTQVGETRAGAGPSAFCSFPPPHSSYIYVYAALIPNSQCHLAPGLLVLACSGLSTSAHSSPPTAAAAVAQLFWVALRALQHPVLVYKVWPGRVFRVYYRRPLPFPRMLISLFFALPLFSSLRAWLRLGVLFC